MITFFITKNIDYFYLSCQKISQKAVEIANPKPRLISQKV
ncbi:hypothetical protein LX64_03515 [Chitinophaga skermanii]|uniref:Uncharacterized protein n=1 Tax=Chitinophaga skermanii TaxID=331697 RepID=A0A327QCX9_9BACT|nr:hypothetical protein LX64_03515 [Chitinophaga skermanii]